MSDLLFPAFFQRKREATVPFSFRLTESQTAIVRELAEQRGISLADMIRLTLELYFVTDPDAKGYVRAVHGSYLLAAGHVCE